MKTASMRRSKKHSWMSNEKTTTPEKERNDVDDCSVESLFILQLPTSCHVFIVRGFRYWLILGIYITRQKFIWKGKGSTAFESAWWDFGYVE